METIYFVRAISLFASYCGDFVTFSSLLCLALDTEGQLNAKRKCCLDSLEGEWKAVSEKKCSQDLDHHKYDISELIMVQ